MFSVRNELFGVNEVNWKWLKQEVEVAKKSWKILQRWLRLCCVVLINAWGERRVAMSAGYTTSSFFSWW
jgi:hypothetical protein